jgi:tetratricopeptide (TPR) repeat protein
MQQSVKYLLFIILLSCQLNIFHLIAQQKDTARVFDPAGELYKKALKEIDSLKYKEAIKILHQAIKKNPEMTAAYNKSAFCKLQVKDFKGAQKDLEHSLKIDHDHEETIKYLGRAYYLDKKYNEAKKNYDEAIKIAMDDYELIYFIAELKIEGNDIDGAISSINDCLFYKPNYAPAIIKRGILKFKQKEYKYAIRDITEGLNLQKDTNVDVEIYRVRANANFEVADFRAAISDYTKVLKKLPNDEEALVYRGGAKINVNDNSGAIDDLNKAITINKKNHTAFNFRGTAKGGLKQYVDALNDLDQSIKLKFDYHSAYVNRAAIKMASKDKKGACSDLEKADQLGSPIAYKLIQQYCAN